MGKNDNVILLLQKWAWGRGSRRRGIPVPFNQRYTSRSRMSSNINLKPVSSIHGTSHPLSGISSGGMRAVPPFVGFVPTTVALRDTAAGIGSGDPVPYGSRFPTGNPVCCDRTDTYGVDPIITLHIVQFYLF